jgi:hypothetical protein
MSVWFPNDVVFDSDLQDYEQSILTQFGKTDWQAKRRKALEDWAFPTLAKAGYVPERLRTRRAPAQVWGYTGGSYVDYTSAATTVGVDGLPLGTVFAAPSSDFLYIGSQEQFRGLSIRMLDRVATAAGTLTVQVWSDAWTSVGTLNETQFLNVKPFSRGGDVRWEMPQDWVTRAVNGSAPLYWARIKVSATPTGAYCGQIGCIRGTALTGPVTLRTLGLIFREAQTMQGGPWQDKADAYFREAEDAMQGALSLVARDFDTVTIDDQIDTTETTQTAGDVTGGGASFQWTRA